MHALVWSSAGQRFATASAHVKVVLPLVKALPLAHQPPWVCGLINYRERLIPMLDMAVLLGYSSPEPRMVQRVIVMQAVDDGDVQLRLFGLRVDSVLGLEDVEFGDSRTAAVANAAGMEFLGPATLAESGTIQWVDANRFPALDRELPAIQ